MNSRLVAEDKALALDAFQCLQAGLLVCDPRGEVLLANRAAAQILGLEGEVAPGADLAALLAPLDQLLRRDQAELIFEGPHGPRRIGYEVLPAEQGRVVVMIRELNLPLDQPPVRPTPATGVPRLHAIGHHGLNRDTKEVVSIMARRAQQGEAFTLPEYLQMAGLGRHSLRVLAGRGGREQGWVLLVRGELWAARCGTLRGEEAVRALLNLADLRIDVESIEGEPGEREMQAPVEAVLLDAFRSLEERTSPPAAVVEPREEVPAASIEPPVPAPVRRRRSTAAPSFEALMSSGREAVLLQDYARAWHAFEAAARLKPEHEGARASLERLAALGHASSLPVGLPDSEAPADAPPPAVAAQAGRSAKGRTTPRLREKPPG